MPDAAAPVASAPANIGKGLSHKLGPFPVWGWLAIVGGVGGLVYFFVIAPAQNQGQSGLDSLLPGLAGGGGGSPAGTSTVGVAPAPAVLSNTGWVSTAAAAVSSSLGLPLSEVTSYLNEYIAGQAPAGSNQAQTTFSNVIQSALQLSGQPPQPVIAGSVNPFQNQPAWLSALLAALPSGTSQDIQNQIINLSNGTASTLTQDAANAYQAALGIVGIGPTPLTYSIAGSIPTGGTTGTFTQALQNAWANVYLALPSASQTYSAWVAAAPSVITQGFNTTQLQNLFNFFNTSQGQAAVSAAGGPVNLINSYLANPSLIPTTPAAPTVALPTVRA